MRKFTMTGVHFTILTQADWGLGLIAKLTVADNNE